jgi:AcrR family transcriptional regulator
MKSVPVPPPPRQYRMRARAQATAVTRAAILRAVLELHLERFHHEITLDLVAERARVTVQTVLRHFGSRDALIAAAAEQATRDIVMQRSAAPVGDIDGAVDNLLDHYDEWGSTALRLLAQEEMVPQLRAIADAGRAAHHAWVDRTFAPELAASTEPHLRATLIAITDVYAWKVLHVDLGLDRAAMAEALSGMIHAVIREGRRR